VFERRPKAAHGIAHILPSTPIQTPPKRLIRTTNTQALGIALKLTFQGNNQLTDPHTLIFIVVLATCLLTQIDYLNKALDLFNTAVVSPIYYVMFTLLTITASVIMFQVGWGGG